VVDRHRWRFRNTTTTTTTTTILQALRLLQSTTWKQLATADGLILMVVPVAVAGCIRCQSFCDSKLLGKPWDRVRRAFWTVLYAATAVFVAILTWMLFHDLDEARARLKASQNGRHSSCCSDVSLIVVQSPSADQLAHITAALEKLQQRKPQAGCYKSSVLWQRLNWHCPVPSASSWSTVPTREPVEKFRLSLHAA